uniref:Ycf45 n=1 Tax=Haramonas pauciplastida TaxID=478668 RepID=UPI0021140CA7|nr:Ycf45 [Haramonas pauciplastida]UTE94916.1 Ycf45 [Haramonas pauciplastida]
MLIKKNLTELLNILPKSIRQIICQHPKQEKLDEIILDVGRRPQIRFGTKSEYLSTKVISKQDIQFCTKKIGTFNNKHRSGIKYTLHRISCIKNQHSTIIGLTYRVGRITFGICNIIRDLLKLNSSILILGRPGSGKTTMIREISRILSSEISRHVIVVDTSNEIAGGTDIPNRVIGHARRISVRKTMLLGTIMIEAVENHTPQTIMIDEISNENQVKAARTICERGVQLIASVHGINLESLVKNPILSDLIGGIESVTISDESARRREQKKNILERKNLPTFETVISLSGRSRIAVYLNINTFVDNLLNGKSLTNQVRKVNSSKKISIHCGNKKNYNSKYF